MLPKSLSFKIINEIIFHGKWAQSFTKQKVNNVLGINTVIMLAV